MPNLSRYMGRLVGGSMLESDFASLKVFAGGAGLLLCKGRPPPLKSFTL
jgi:hypothetical protein